MDARDYISLHKESIMDQMVSQHLGDGIDFGSIAEMLNEMAFKEGEELVWESNEVDTLTPLYEEMLEHI